MDGTYFHSLETSHVPPWLFKDNQELPCKAFISCLSTYGCNPSGPMDILLYRLNIPHCDYPSAEGEYSSFQISWCLVGLGSLKINSTGKDWGKENSKDHVLFYVPVQQWYHVPTVLFLLPIYISLMLPFTSLTKFKSRWALPFLTSSVQDWAPYIFFHILYTLFLCWSLIPCSSRNALRHLCLISCLLGWTFGFKVILQSLEMLSRDISMVFRPIKLFC